MPQHQTESPAGDPVDARVADTSEVLLIRRGEPRRMPHGGAGAEVSWLREQAQLVEIE